MRHKRKQQDDKDDDDENITRERERERERGRKETCEIYLICKLDEMSLRLARNQGAFLMLSHHVSKSEKDENEKKTRILNCVRLLI